MNADTRSSRRQARLPVEDPATNCTKCPVCGSEECLLLEELGNYCATMTAASLSKYEAEKAARRS